MKKRAVNSETKKEVSKSADRELATLPVGTPVSLDVLPQLLGYNVRRAQLELWRDFGQSVSNGEVRPGLFGLLVLVGANAGIAQIELANHLAVDKASMVALIDRLEASDWVVRKRSLEDRRRHGIFLTPAGIKKLAQLKREVSAHDQKFVDRFTKEEFSRFLEFLQRVRR